AQTQIVSPLSGTVVQRFVYEGQYVKEGDKLFEIADFSTMWFRFDAYENDLPWFTVGEEIEITTPSAPNKIYKAKINFIDPNISDSTRSAKVRVEIANPIVEQDGKKRRELLHKVYADGRLKVIFPETLVVPRSAVLNSGGDPIVYLDRGDGAYEPRKIKLGISGDEGWQVREGLDEGDRVVTSGNLLIDAQAQFNQGGTSAEAAPKGTEQSASKLPPLNEAQQKITTEFFAVASQISGALANDDFKAYNELAAKLPALLPTLTEAFAKDLERKKPIEQIERAGHLPKAEDLAAARKSFVPFSMATVELAKTLRVGTNSAAVKIYKCPMANQAVPGAPKSGFWIQTKGPLHNPFFGSAMLDCGSEVKP
ncbi:MAG: efflux RND transporter periplasmic adaptor subunit, partial [Verrucomicrobiota bacterium]